MAAVLQLGDSAIIRTAGAATASSVPSHLNRSAKKTMDVVYLVEKLEQPGSIPSPWRATRLVSSTLLGALDDRIQRGKWEAALKVFNLLREQEWYEADVATYIKLLTMLGKCKQPDVAFSVFQMMQEENCALSSQVYTALLSAYSRSNHLENAFVILEKMKRTSDCQPDVYTYSELVRACSEALLFDRVDMLLSEMKSLGLEPNTVTYNILMNAYGKAGMLKEMENLFMQMVEGEVCKPDTWTQNAMLRTYAQAGNIEAMEICYMKLQSLGYKPNVITFNTLLSAYGKNYLFDKMESVIDYMHKYQYRGNTATYNIMIDSYAKAGLIHRVREVYHEMLVMGVKEDNRTFCSLIDAFGKQGIWPKVGKVLRQLHNSGIEPDTAVYNAALDAYRRANMKVEMQEVLQEMERMGCQADNYTKSILSMATRKNKL